MKNGNGYLGFGLVGVANPDFKAMFRIIGLQDKLIFKVKPDGFPHHASLLQLNQLF